jgi:type II secretory pathway component PulC
MRATNMAVVMPSQVRPLSNEGSPASMKISVLVLTLAMSIASARANLALTGIMITSERPMFVLSSEQEKTSGWITIGQSFDGYTIVAFDPGSELLVLEKDGKRQELRLRQAKVGEAKPEDAKARLRTLKGLELAYELAKNGDQQLADLLQRYQQATTTTVENGGQDKYAVAWLKKRIDEVATEKAAKLLVEK